MVVLMNILTIFMMISVGSTCTGVIFVGNSLGKGKPDKAKQYAKVITFYTFIVLLAIAVLLYAFR